MCERLSVMQEQARLVKFLEQNSLSAPTQVFEECGVQNTPPNEKLDRTWDFEFWVVKNTPLRMCGVETNRCIPHGYSLVCLKVKRLQDS